MDKIRKNRFADLRKKVYRFKVASISPEKRNVWCQLFRLAQQSYSEICNLNDPTLMHWIEEIKLHILEATGFSEAIIYVSYDASEYIFREARENLRRLIRQISDLLGNYIVDFPDCPRLAQFAAVLFTYTMLQRVLRSVVYTGVSSDSDLSNLSPSSKMNADFKEEPTPVHVNKNFYNQDFTGEKINDKLKIVIVPAETAKKAEGWLQVIGPLGEYGYYNEETNEFNFEPPPEFEQCLKTIVDDRDYVKHFDVNVKAWVANVLNTARQWALGVENSIVFYKNLETDVIIYDKPEELHIFHVLKKKKCFDLPKK